MKNYLTALEYCFENGDFVKSRAGNVKNHLDIKCDLI